MSPRATEAWYAVYLFEATGQRVYLSLNQGTTEWTGSDYRRRPVTELHARVRWARHVINAIAGTRTDLLPTIELNARRSALPAAYEHGNVVAFAYDYATMPDEAVLERDLLFMARLLGHVYAAYTAAPYVPGDPAPEVAGVMAVAAEAAGAAPARRRGGQGFGLSKPEQTAVERRAVDLARSHLCKQGWHVRYVGARETWDVEATRGDEKLYVEVKGTTSPGESVVLTGAQVREYRKRQPHTALIVVHDIQLARGDEPTASGGVVSQICPWEIDDAALNAIAWTYRTGLVGNQK
jgi:hypothetical protein